jgi:hypothetical protein
VGHELRKVLAADVVEGEGGDGLRGGREGEGGREGKKREGVREVACGDGMGWMARMKRKE